MWKALLFSVLPFGCLLSPTCRADEVLLSNLNNHYYGQASLYSNQAYSDDFTLDLPTVVYSITTFMDRAPGAIGNNWEVEISGRGISFTWPPAEAGGDGLILPAGSYGVNFIAGSCPIPGVSSCLVAGVSFYIPNPGMTDLTYTEIGGTMSGPYGFMLRGESITPEPSSWILLGTALMLSSPLLATKYARASRLPIFPFWG